MSEARYKIFGLHTGDLYAEGTEEECSQQIQRKFKSVDKRRTEDKKPLSIYPEPLRKVRIGR